MRIQKRHHTIDVMFPMALLLTFTVLAVLVLLMAASIYGRAQMTGARNDNARTAAAYLSEKIRQYDAQGAVSLTEFDGCQALALVHQEGDRRFVTYIYGYDGALRELMLKEGARASAAEGEPILPLRSISMEQLQPGLLRFETVDPEGRMTTACQALHAREVTP